MLLGALERFGGYTLATLLEEDTYILQLLQLESFGDRADEKEKLDELEEKASRLESEEVN